MCIWYEWYSYSYSIYNTLYSYTLHVTDSYETADEQWAYTHSIDVEFLLPFLFGLTQ